MYSGIDDFLQLLGGIHVCRVTRNLFLLYPMYVLEIDNVLQLVNQVLPRVQLLVGPLGLACVAVLPVKTSHLIHPSETSGDDTLLHHSYDLPAIGADLGNVSEYRDGQLCSQSSSVTSTSMFSAMYVRPGVNAAIPLRIGLPASS